MTLSPSQRAALRAKKAIANGNTNFKPRGEKNKVEFEALKKQAQTTQTTTIASNIISAESPPQKRMKITLDINLNKTSDTLDDNTINICIHIFKTPLVSRLINET